MSEFSKPPAARPIEAICEHYGWTRTFVYQKLGTGDLEAVKAGRRTVVLTASAERLHASLPRASFRQSRQRAA